jgi:hypothetical protein
MVLLVFTIKFTIDVHYGKFVASHQEIATKCSRKHKYSSRTVYCHSGYLDELILNCGGKLGFYTGE